MDSRLTNSLHELLMTSQSIADDVTMTRQLWREHVERDVKSSPDLNLTALAGFFCAFWRAQRVLAALGKNVKKQQEVSDLNWDCIKRNSINIDFIIYGDIHGQSCKNLYRYYPFVYWTI